MKCLKKNDHKITQKHRETNTEELMYDMVIFSEINIEKKLNLAVWNE